MEHLPHVAPEISPGRASSLASSQQSASDRHLSASLLSTANDSSILTPIKESALAHRAPPLGPTVLKSTEQICTEITAKAARLANSPTICTARAIGFGSVREASSQLMQELLISKQQIKGRIATVKLKNTPSTSGNFLYLKELLLCAQQKSMNLEELTSTSDGSAQRKRP